MTTSPSEDGTIPVYCPECDVHTERSPDEIRDVCFNCSIETVYTPIKAPPAIEDTGHDGFYFEEVFGTPSQIGIGFAVSDL
jgi:hypothetical protein